MINDIEETIENIWNSWINANKIIICTKRKEKIKQLKLSLFFIQQLI